ncbi:MAG: DUF3794 domain-containing protein [Clostridia bacterium]|nr:DUF3794 domain-containing protein [Clostridia bacterium]
MDTMKIDIFLGQSETKGQIEGDIKLPSEKTDMEKLFHTDCIVNVREKETVKDAVKIAGDAELTIYYIDTEGKLQSFSATAPFNIEIEAKGATPESKLNLLWRTEEVNASLTDKREAKVNASVLFSANLSAAANTAQIPQTNTEIKRAPAVLFNTTAIEASTFHITEEVRVPAGMDDVENIVGVKGYGILSGIKNEGTSAVCYGEICLNTVYTSENGIWQFCDSIPFEEELASADLEGKELYANVQVRKISAASYDKDTISYGISGVITLSVLERNEQGPVVDVYSLTHNLETAKRHISLKSPGASDTVKYTLRNTASAPKNARPVLVMADTTVTGEYAMDGTVNLEGNICCDILYLTSEGELEPTHLKMPVDESIPAPAVKEDYEIFLTPNVQRVSAVSMGDEAEIRTALDIGITAFKQKELDIIESVEEKEPLIRENSSVMIYFKEEDEDLFDIAKAYHISPRDIKSESGNKLILINPA